MHRCALAYSLPPPPYAWRVLLCRWRQGAGGARVCGAPAKQARRDRALQGRLHRRGAGEGEEEAAERQQAEWRPAAAARPPIGFAAGTIVGAVDSAVRTPVFPDGRGGDRDVAGRGGRGSRAAAVQQR